MEPLACSNQSISLAGMEFLSPEDLQQPYKDPEFYVGSYGLQGPIWDKVRNHPEFINHVRNSIDAVQDQIDGIRNYQSDHPKGMKHTLLKAAAGFGDMQRMANQVKKDTGYRGDWQDIVISAQRHPMYLKKLAQRDALKQKRDNLEVM